MSFCEAHMWTAYSRIRLVQYCYSVCGLPYAGLMGSFITHSLSLIFFIMFFNKWEWWRSGHCICSVIGPLKEALAILVWGLGYALYLPDVSSGYTWKSKTCMLGFSKCLCHTCVLSSFQKWRLCLPTLLHWPSFRCMQCHQLLLETQSLYRTLGFGQHFELPVSQTGQSKHYPTIEAAVFKIGRGPAARHAVSTLYL